MVPTDVGTVLWAPELEDASLAAAHQQREEGGGEGAQRVDGVPLGVGPVHCLGWGCGGREEREREKDLDHLEFSIILRHVSLR